MASADWQGGERHTRDDTKHARQTCALQVTKLLTTAGPSGQFGALSRPRVSDSAPARLWSSSGAWTAASPGGEPVRHVHGHPGSPCSSAGLVKASPAVHRPSCRRPERLSSPTGRLPGCSVASTLRRAVGIYNSDAIRLSGWSRTVPSGRCHVAWRAQLTCWAPSWHLQQQRTQKSGRSHDLRWYGPVRLCHACASSWLLSPVARRDHLTSRTSSRDLRGQQAPESDGP